MPSDVRWRLAGKADAAYGGGIEFWGPLRLDVDLRYRGVRIEPVLDIRAPSVSMQVKGDGVVGARCIATTAGA